MSPALAGRFLYAVPPGKSKMRGSESSFLTASQVTPGPRKGLDQGTGTLFLIANILGFAGDIRCLLQLVNSAAVATVYKLMGMISFQ